MKKWLPVILALSFAAFSDAHAAGISELMDIARAQKDAQNAYSEETKAFERIKSAIDSGAVKKGQPAKEIEGCYGEPVVSINDSRTGRTKWIYKPAKSSFFSGIRVYLYFDKDNNLDEIKAVE